MRLRALARSLCGGGGGGGGGAVRYTPRLGLTVLPSLFPPHANGAQICVDSTARAAFFLGYNVVVLSDATETSQSDAVQAATLANLELIVGDVMTSAVFEGRLVAQQLLPRSLPWRRNTTATPNDRAFSLLSV